MNHMNHRPLYVVVLLGGLIGMTAAFLQTLEKLTLLAHPSATLYCSISSVFSCSTVLKAWQSSVFGFPNSIMCLVLFTIFTVTAAIGLSSPLSRRVRLSVQLLALATLGFGMWFLWQSIYVISAVCLFCLFCMLGLLLINAAWLRCNNLELPPAIRRFVQSGYDSVGWLVVALLVALAVIIRFYL